MVSGYFKEIGINDLCLKSNGVVHKVIPVLLNQNEAMNACKILQAELAYPKTLDQFKKWQSTLRFLINGHAHLFV